ncbi:MAG TPA: hypothetical protein PKX87_04545 [Alphaproteobacteria bacterium]|nr:hypothetical protein [Alphaproteobacteria bacterium]
MKLSEEHIKAVGGAGLDNGGILAAFRPLQSAVAPKPEAAPALNGPTL